VELLNDRLAGTNSLMEEANNLRGFRRSKSFILMGIFFLYNFLLIHPFDDGNG